MGVSMKVDTSEFKRQIEEERKEAQERVKKTLELVGERTIAHLRSFTNERNRRGRLKHPGGWADRSGEMSARFYYKVFRGQKGWILEIGNTAPHVHIVEAVDGIFVVRGITDPDGYAMKAFREAVSEVAPDWKVAA